MAVTGTTRKQTFNMDGAVLDFDFTFRALINSPDDIKCKLITKATGVEADLTYLTDYTVSIDSDGVGGTVTVTDAQSTAYQLLVYRETTNTQESQYDDYNSFPASTLNEDLDKRTLVEQEIAEVVDRCVKIPIASSIDPELPSPSANKILGWNTDATGLENKVALDKDVQAACEAAQLGAETAETGAVAAQAAAEAARDAAEAVAGIEMASEAEAQAGTNNTKLMTPLRTKQGALALVLDEDNMATDSATQPPSQQSVKAYVNTYVDGTWADYSGTSTVTGWSAFTTKQIYYKKVGSTVFVNVYLAGTSNATAITFTLPFAMSSASGSYIVSCGVAGDGGTQQTLPSYLNLAANSSTAYVYKTLAAGAWTASGSKYILVSFWYESA
jgi:hypothetical protein